MKKKILFLGGAYAQIPILLEAKKRGHYIITCDYLPDNPGHKIADEYHDISTTDIEGILALAIEVKPDFIVAYASDPAAPVAAYVSEKLDLPSNSYQSVQILSEKDLFRSFLLANNFNTPKHVVLTDGYNVVDKLKMMSFPIMIKPTDSSGSKGVTRVDQIDEIDRALKNGFEFSRNKRLIAEEFIDSNGEQLHGDGFVSNGNLIFSYLGDHHYNSKINPFVPSSTTWPSIKNENLINKVEEEVQRLIQKVGFRNGAINIEARIDVNDKVFIMEVGPRSGGNFVPQAISYATGFDMVKASLDIFEGKKVSVEISSTISVAYYVIHSDKAGIFMGLTISNQIQAYIKEAHQYVATGDLVKPFSGSGNALGLLILAFDNRLLMNHMIDNIENHIHVNVV